MERGDLLGQRLRNLVVRRLEAKKLINDMVTDGTLEYWSSGSTSMYGLKGTGKQQAAEHEE